MNPKDTTDGQPFLDESYQPYWESLSDHEPLDEYMQRVRPECSDTERHFWQHVIFDHFDNFVGRFAWFDPSKCAYEFRDVTAEWISSNVRCEYDLSMWDHFYANPHKGSLPELMKSVGTWPIEPVIFEIEDSRLRTTNREFPLSPYHLIEGTHRVNYLNRMLDDGLIAPESKHRLLVLVYDP